MIYASILAAGVGMRMHRQDLPKQFLPLGEKPIIINTLEQFFINKAIDKIIVVAPDEWRQFTEDLISKYDNMGTEIHVITGGVSKAESVYLVYEYIKENWGVGEDDILLTHDAVRPFITQRIISDNIEAAKEYGAACTAMTTNDTIAVSDDGVNITGIPTKRTMFAEQTPFTFKISALEEVLRGTEVSSLANETELTRLFTADGRNIRIVAGEYSNMKIVNPYDLEVANALLTEIKR